MFKKRSFHVAVFAVIALAFAGVSLLPSRSYAAETTPNNNVLKVAPVRSDIVVSPGQSHTVEATVTNITNSPITIRAIANDFIAGDEQGAPALILAENEYAPNHSLKRFMGPLPTVTIPAGKGTTIRVVIKVPANAAAGGYYGAVRFAPSSATSGGEVNMNASAASLILLTVPGDMVEAADLTNFEIQQSGKSGEFFQSSNSLETFVRFKNNGSTHVGPTGKISVKSGDKVVYEYDFNAEDPKDMVLPDSARYWRVPLKNIGSFGKYTVHATFTYGSKNKTVEAVKSFWVVPVVVIIGTVVGVLVLVGLIVGIWLFLRSYKRRILRSSGRRF